MNKKHVILLIVVVVSYLIGKHYGDTNRTIQYGDTGFPKNCRAIITANIDGWRIGDYQAEEVLESIDRNCGAYGYSWGK